MHIAYRGPNSGTRTGWGGAQSATTRKVLPHFPVGPGARESWTPDSWKRAQRLNKLKAERLVEPEARAERVAGPQGQPCSAPAPDSVSPELLGNVAIGEARGGHRPGERGAHGGEGREGSVLGEPPCNEGSCAHPRAVGVWVPPRGLAV